MEIESRESIPHSLSHPTHWLMPLYYSLPRWRPLPHTDEPNFYGTMGQLN
jgi:hypothetical protein